MNIDELRGIDTSKIAGLENFNLDVPKLPFVKILNGSAAVEVNLPAGTVINSTTNEVIADTKSAFKFVPVYFFTDWTVWDDRKLVKRAFAKVGTWTDGTPIRPEEVSWVGGVPPKAQEALNFVVLPTTELTKEEPQYLLLAMAFSNKERVKVARELRNLIATTTVSNQFQGIFWGAYELSVTAFQNDDKQSWYDWTKPTFLKVVAEKTKELSAKIYQEVKILDKVTTVAVIPEVVSPNRPSVNDNTEF
jgi:hypothetical protein